MFCHFCKVENEHEIKDCEVLKSHKCRRCGEKGHSVKSCPKPERLLTKPKILCKFCKKEGHTVKDCADLAEKKKNMFCQFCGEEGDHTERNCTSPYNVRNIGRY